MRTVYDDPTYQPQPLSARQLKVAELLAYGVHNQEIAEHLGIAVKTVDTHRGHILKKLNLRNNVELARHALRQGWVTL